MSQPELVIRVVRALDARDIPYMITGSVASSLQGEPRTTHDLDLVVTIGPADVPKLLDAFGGEDFYIEEESVRDAIARCGHFNVVVPAEASKIDFWLLTDEPFDRCRFPRRRAEEAFGVTIRVSAPEDTILAKLRWSALSGGSRKQYVDALRVYEIQRDQLDLAYLREWAVRLGVKGDLDRIEREAEPV